MRLSAADIDFNQLSELERDTLDTLIPRVQDGYEVKEIADELGLDAKDVQARIDNLGAKLMALSGTISLPALSDDEYEALKVSIAEHGQQMPILRGSKTSGLPGQIIDGQHRRRACSQLKVPPVFKDVDGSADQLRSLGLVLNLARRQMSTSSRRGIIKAELLRDASRSDRAIAGAIGVSHPTVAAVRRELEGAGTVEKVSTRTGSDGVAQPVREREERPEPTERSVRVLVPAGRFEELVGPRVDCRAFRLIERRPGVHELQVWLVDAAPASPGSLARVRELADALAATMERPGLLGEFLESASQVFDHPIATVDELSEEEAGWAVGQLEQLQALSAPA